MTSVSLVIALYNQLGHTRQCIDSIKRHSPADVELILVDNGSTDGTADYLRTVDATTILNPTNLGCAKAWNQESWQAGLVVGILNNDILVTPGWLVPVLAFMDMKSWALPGFAAREGVA
ncbi:MAG: glycosyltransferase [Nitrospiraceae bacterium]